MAKFNIEIGAVNADLKKILAESNKLIKQFEKNAQSIKVNIGGGNKRSVDNLNNSLKQTDALLKSIAKSASTARTNLSGVGGTTNNVSSLQKEREELAKLRTQAQAYRTESARLAAEITKLRLVQAQNRSETTAAAGSYRAAQQRLTALGKEIRNTVGGFQAMTPELQRKIQQYRQLNLQLQQFDRSMGLNHRNIGNYRSALGGLGGSLMSAVSGYLSVFAAIQALSSVVRVNAEISDSLADVQRTAELSKEEARGLFDELKNLETRTSLGELTQISVIGGQLGIAKDELVGFTEAVDILSVVLANEIPGGAEAVTESLGKINGVFRVAEVEGLTAGEAMQKTGSAILALGQAGLATGRYLVDFTQRVGGAARTVGVALPTVLAYGATLEEAGVSAEVAGTAVSKLIGQLAVRRNEFFAIARLADASLTLQDFTNLINTDADAALRKFFAGLTAGGKTTTQFYDILGKAKINTERYRNAVLLLSQDQEKLAKLTALSTEEYEKGTKAAEQFELRNTTLGASLDKLTKAWQSLTTSGRIADFFQDIVDGATQALSAIDKLANSNSLREIATRLAGFGNATGNLSASIALANIQADALQKLQSASSGGGGTSFVESFSKQSLAEMERLLKVQEDIVKLRSDTYQSDKSRKNLDELNYQAEILAKIRLEYGLVKKAAEESNNSASADTEENIELSKEQLRLIEQQRKERERLENSVRKLQEENILNSLSGYEKEIQAIKYRYAEEIKAAKGANDIIQRLEIQRAIAVANAIKGSIDPLSTLRGSGTNFQRGQSTAGQLNTGAGEVVQRNIQLPFKPKPDWSDFEDGLKRATTRFVREFTHGLDRVAQEADYKIGGILAGIGSSLVNAMQPVFQNFFSNKLEGILGDAFDNLSKRFGESSAKSVQAIAAGAGVLGGIVSQVSRPTSAAGQGIGGALSGAAAGLAFGPVGAVVGGVIGAISGIIGANRRRKLEEEQLAEQKKQTALMERAQRLAFTSSIIGQQTNQGIITGVDRNEFGDVTFRIQGRDLVAVAQKESTAQGRGL